MKKLLIFLIIGLFLVVSIVVSNTIIEDSSLSTEEVLETIEIIGKDDKVINVDVLCEPVYKTWTEEIPHYKNCTVESVYNISSKTIDEAYNYTCLDYIEKIEHKDEQVDCIEKGKLDVSGEIYEGNDAYCKLEGNKVCCYANKEGGRYAATWRTDGSVDKECRDLITDKVELISTTGAGFIK